MRDITTGGDITVGRDFIVSDQSEEHKLLIHCTNDKLVAEERFRQSEIARGRPEKIKRRVAVVACLVVAAAAYCWFTDRLDASDLLMPIGPFLLALGSLWVVYYPTEVEKRHLNAIREIKILLRERGVR